MRGRIIVPLLAGAVLLAVSSCKKKVDKLGINDSAIQLIDSIHDFGTFRGEGVVKRCKFRLRNAGTEPLVIHEIETSCGCTTPQFSQAPIAPGDVTVITVDYDGRGKAPGQFVKTLDIFSNARSGIATLTIKGNMEK